MAIEKAGNGIDMERVTEIDKRLKSIKNSQKVSDSLS